MSLGLLIAQVAGREAACGPAADASAVCELVFDLTHNDGLARASDALIVTPSRVLLIVVLAWLVNRLFHRAVRRFVGTLRGERMQRSIGALKKSAPRVIVEGVSGPTPRAAQRAQTIGALLRSITTAVIWGIALLMILSELGLNLGPLIAGAGIVGVAVGFGAQNLVRDFLSGIFMLLEDQYGVGDIIDAGEATGVVEGISLRTTRLRDVEGTVWHIPNGTIARVGNKSQQWSRALLDIEVAYDTDIDLARSVIKRVADELWTDELWAPSIVEEPEVWGVENLGADGIAIRVAIKTLPSEQFKVGRELRQRLKSVFDAEGIEIPFPQRTVWHRNADGAAKPPIADDQP
jgi:moderate conductance mechanosensitive channel